MSTNAQDYAEALKREWEERRQYEVVGQSPDRPPRVIKGGLTWDEANAIAVRLQRRHDERHPLSSTSILTTRLYWARLGREAAEDWRNAKPTQTAIANAIEKGEAA